MRAWALGLLLVGSLWGASGAINDKKNRIFIGVMTGFRTAKLSSTPWDNAFSWGIEGGYQYDIRQYISLRTAINYLQTLKPTAFNTKVDSLLSWNMGVVSDFYKLSKKMLIGVYADIGFGYFQSAMTLSSPIQTRSFMGYNGVFDFGVGGTLEKQHRVELGVKFPFGEVKSIKKPSTSLRAFYWIASYAYLF
ncbi:hypothetical protein [Helicobacter cynogastricus]|uniref:hypothetical protein n=1 Tax=Helicobacter cynogastricus TaxID=329937 RepID=UPI000CF0DA2B|nr:hypothetical protein [Helicobacter cynogastricus]